MANESVWQTSPVCGGVNNTLPDTLISDAELSDCANYMPDKMGQGWLIKREGLTKVDTNQRTATTYSVFDGKLGNYYTNGTALYTSDGTSRATGLTAAFSTWASFNALDIFANGTDLKQTSNGTSFSDLAGFPAGVKYLCSANNFLYYAPAGSVGEVGWTSVGTTTYVATNTRVLTNNEGDDIVGLAKVPNGVGVWCQKSFYVVTGWSDIGQQVSYTNNSEGCTATQRAICVTPYGTFWWSHRGLVWWKGGSELDYPMERKIAKTLAGLNRTYDSLVHGVWDSIQGRLMYWVCNGASTTCSLRIDYYPREDSFYLMTGAGVAMSASAPVEVSGTRYIYCGGYNPTYLYSVSGLTDDGTAITAFAESKRLGSPAIEGQGGSAFLATNLGGTETITYGDYIDNATSATTANYSIASGLQFTRLATNRHHKLIKHRIGDAATTTRSKILGLYYSDDRHKVVR